MQNAWETIRRYAEKPERLIIGLMSGTSVDGVDAALVRISGTGRETRAELVAFVMHPYPPKLREMILRLSANRGNARAISQTHVAVGALFADAADAVLRRANITAEDIDAVASHGQTISHTPPPPRSGKSKAAKTLKQGATLQIGDAAVIAERLRVPVISDFRAADMAAGGQGAPLVPYADWCLLTHPTKSRAVQNIGGIGNVTYLPANAAPEQVIGFDTGPGNMLIDRAVQWATSGQETFDRDGRWAGAGKTDYDLLEQLLDHKFLLKKPPKSAGREDFGEAFWERLMEGIKKRGAAKSGAGWIKNLLVSNHPPPSSHINPGDLLATLTAFTALSIADAYERFLPALPDEIIIGGGGARNLTLLKMLRERFGAERVLTHESAGIHLNSDAKEALAFALLANETLLGFPSNLPSVTGARRSVIQGKITLP